MASIPSCFFFYPPPISFFIPLMLRRRKDLNKVARWKMEPGEADLLASTGPSARLPPTRGEPGQLCPPHVVVGSLHFQLGGSWTLVGHLSDPDTWVHTRPSVNYHLHGSRVWCWWECGEDVTDAWHCCVIIITLSAATPAEVKYGRINGM